MWGNIAFGLTLLAISGLLMARGKSTAQWAGDAPLSEAEHDFFRSQTRRRRIANLLIALAGVVVIAGSGLPAGWPALMMWMFVLLIVLILLGIASVDLLRTRRFLNVVRRRHTEERARLEAELVALRSRRGNGNGRKTSPDA